jgi:hypothetical protein
LLFSGAFVKKAGRNRGFDRAGGEVDRVAFAVSPNQNAPGELQMGTGKLASAGD